MAKLTKGMREVDRYRKLLNRGMVAVETDDPVAIARIAEEIIHIKWHNPFWVSLVALAIGNILRKAAFTPLRRLGWTLMGYGAASTAAEGIGIALDIAEQVGNIRKGFTGEGTPVPEKGGIGEP